MPLPAIFREHCLAGGEMGERHGKGRCQLGAATGQQVQLGQLLPLRGRGNQGSAAVELADNFENVFLDCLRRGPRREQSANAQMGCGPFSLRDQRVGRLLKAVVDKPIGACLGFYQFLTDGRPQV